MSDVTAERFAIYYAPPPDSPLWRYGSSVIGYDAATGEAAAHPDTSLDWPSLTVSPRRYGFHATLKAPAHLRAGTGIDDVLALADEVAAMLRPVTLAALAVRSLGRFVALVPDADDAARAAQQTAEIARLAQTVCEAFEPLRAPLSEFDRGRLGRPGLTPRQRENLERFGYPYVRDDFRFHMTLTDALQGVEAERRAVCERLAALYAPVDRRPIVIDQIVVYRQPDRQSPFRIVDRFTVATGEE